MLIVVLQRCHYLWTAPFFDAVLREHGIQRAFVYRLTVMDQVFELLALYALGFGVLSLGPRRMLAAGTLAWLSRSLLLAWLAQTDASARVAVSCLFASQILSGLATVAFFGTVAAVLRLHRDRVECSRPVLLAAVAGTVGILLGGVIGDAMPGQHTWQWLARFPEAIDLGLLSIQLRGWPGAWWISALPALVATVVVLLAKPSELDASSRAATG